jgi:hypothetical protein
VKTFSQLKPVEQEAAKVAALTKLMTRIVEGSISFVKPSSLQKRIDQACKKANNMQTPWFAHEYVMDTCAADLKPIAEKWAEDAHYREPQDMVLELAAA